MALNRVFPKKYIVLSALVLAFTTLKVYAQEPNFSMYHYAPFFTNPGSIGVVQDARLMLNYRNQSIEEGNSFKTSSLSAYYPIYLGNHRLVVAGNFLNDQVSDFVKTNGGLLGLAYSISLTSASELSFGLQGGYFQRIIGNDFVTDDQFVDGVFDPTIISSDGVLNQSANYATLSAGLYYQIKDVHGDEKGFVGASIFNLTEPNVSFVESQEDKLPSSLRMTAGYRVYQGVNFSVLPTLRWVNQANNSFVNIGSRFGYELTEKEDKKIELGLWYNSNDLGVFSMAYQQSNLTIGVSYDLPVGNDLSATQNGVFELVISLRLKKRSKRHVPQKVAIVSVESTPNEKANLQETTPEEVEETKPILEKLDEIIPETIIEEEKLDVEALNVQFSHRDYLIRFENASGSNVTSDNQEKVINEVAKVLLENPEVNVLIVGHASSVGGSDVNQKISEERAEKIVNVLMSNGIAASRITYIGCGESEPIEDNSTEYGASENRRVQVIFRVENN